MELKKRVDFRKVVIFGYAFLFLVYLIVGLTPAEAAHYNVDANLIIPSIGLNSEVTRLELSNHKLETPDEIVGSFSRYENQTLLIGHSSTVFTDLENVQIGDTVLYDDEIYIIYDKMVLEKSKISMNELLDDTRIKNLTIMTCAGEELDGGDATHRLIVRAEIISSEDE